MSELEELKAEKKDRMTGYAEPMMRSACWEYACPCHDDLDRAIAMIENKCGHPFCDKRYVHVYAIGFALCEEHHEQTMAHIKVWQEAEEERDKVITAAKALREAVDEHCDFLGMDNEPVPSGLRQVLIDTAWLEDK